MAELVLDASVALAWIFPDEQSPYADKVLARITATSVLWVPALWWYEVANVIVIGRRAKRLTEADATQTFEALSELPIRSGEPAGPSSAARISMLAQAHVLTAYDAAYLDLAETRGVPLATLDKNLIRAARHAGVALIAA